MKKIISILSTSLMLILMLMTNVYANEIQSYKVPVELRHAYEDKLSMADAALKKEADIKVVNGQTTITLYLKPMEIGGVKENINKLFVIEKDGKIEAKKTSTGESSYDTKVEFTVKNIKPDEVKLAFWVNAMDALQGGKEGSGEQSAILKLDWSKATSSVKEETKNPQKTVPASKNAIKVFVGEKEVEFDAAPVVKNAKVLVPMKAIFVALDAKVTWNQQTKTAVATKGDREISITVDKKEAVVKENGAVKTIKLDVPAKVENGRIYVPLRFIGEAFGNKVGYEKTSNGAKVTIN